jgi:hypothetical protein
MQWTMIGFGCLGGAIPDIIQLIQKRYSTDPPGYLKTASFWIGLFLLIALGGFAAWLGDAKEVEAALADLVHPRSFRGCSQQLRTPGATPREARSRPLPCGDGGASEQEAA